MAVEILRLSGTEKAEAEQAVNVLLDLRAGPRDLRNLLVIDDTALLINHAQLYRRLDTAGRIEEMLCVAIGPCVANRRMLDLPGNLGGTQGSPVLWVSDPAGIDWRVSAAIAIGHPLGKTNGLDCLTEFLSVEEMFKCVYRILIERVPGRVANPGLRLAGQDDETATFAAALRLAIHSLCVAGSGADGPFPELLPSAADSATLAADGSLARYRDEVTKASDRRPTGFGDRFHQRKTALQSRLTMAAAALTALRDDCAKLLRTANTVGELTDNQRNLIAQAGIRFPPEQPYSSLTGTSGVAAEQSPIHRVVVKAIQGGDTLSLVARRLALTERQLKRRGSASYLEELDDRCPPSLLERLARPAKRLPRRMGLADTLYDPGLDNAVRAAEAIVDLVVDVANREWSATGTSHNEVARIRVALDGAARAMTEHVERGEGQESRARGARVSRLKGALTPPLHDLVFRVLAAESAQPSTSQQEAFGDARGRTARLLKDWMLHVEADGVLSRPPFATSSMRDTALYTDEEDVAEIRTVLLYQPTQEMWQLCAPEDLGMLDAVTAPQVVRFASRLHKDALAGILVGDQPVWTSSGSHAGLLRLISLRPGSISSSWTDLSSNAESSVTKALPTTEL